MDKLFKVVIYNEKKYLVKIKCPRNYLGKLDWKTYVRCLPNQNW